jgi:ligand-binding SRPBCC domain-containing protein
MTPWALLTPDIQIVRPAQKETVSGENIETNTILGLRLQLIF